MRKAIVKEGKSVTTLRKGLIHGGNQVQENDFKAGHFDQLIAREKLELVKPVATTPKVAEPQPEVEAKAEDTSITAEPTADKKTDTDPPVDTSVADDAPKADDAPVPVPVGRRKKK